MIEPRLRELGSENLASLLALEQEGGAEAWTPAQWQVVLSDPEAAVLGLEVEAMLVGHAVVARLPFEAELQAILVAPAWREQGLARRLLLAVIERAHLWRAERLLLEVRAGNRAAIALYHRQGFREDGRRRGYYPPRIQEAACGENRGGREDAVLMSLSLGDG